MKTNRFIAAATVAALFGLAGSACAAAAVAPAGKSVRSCFYSRSWDGWRSPDENTIYLRVGVKDVYKVDLSAGSRLLTYTDSHLVNRLRGTDLICSPLDLDLKVSDGVISVPIIAKSITKLTPEQVAMIPKKYLP